MAMVLLVGALAVVGCDNDDDGGGNFVDATPAQLANQSFALADGAALDGSLANQAMNLTFGPFDASNTAPFQVQSGDTSSSGTATLQSPLTLTFLIVDAGLPFAVNQQISLDARVDPDGRLEVSNTQTGATSTSDPGTESPAPPVVLLATLSGGQEVPGVTTAGSGSAAVTFNADRTRIAYTLAYTGLTDVTQAHIHAGAAGENGPVILFLCTNLANVPQDVPTPQACPTPDGTLTGTLTAADLLPNEEADVTTFAEAVDALLSGNAYANVHTATVASGEIRGQIGAAELQATLSGTQEVPPVETPGSGSGTLRLNDTQTVLTYTLDYTDVTDVTQAHVHVGTAEENGPVVLFLCTNLDAPQGVPAPQACPTPAGMVSGTLSAADLIAVEGAMAFAEAVNAVLSGNTYMNVHSTNFPAGEIRGKVRPRIIEFADAAIFFEFNATDLDLGLQLFFDGEGWRAVEVSSPDGTIFKVSNGGSLQEIGSTEVFTESEEPELTESEDPTDAEIDAAIAAFLARFPAGEYAFAGITIEGETIEGTAMLTHNLPAAPQLVFPDPEADENIADPVDTVITWEAGDPAVVRYQVVVEFEEEGTERVFEVSVDVLADPEAATQSVTIPPEFFAGLAGLEGEYKAEVLAVEASGNRTISEQEFEVGE